MTTALAADREPPLARGPGRLRRLRRDAVRYRWLFLLMLPGLVYFALFRFWPMYGARIAFKNYIPFLGIDGSEWVGFAHFQAFLSNPDFPRLLVNTLVIAALSLLIAFPLTIVLALLLNELRLQILKRTVQTLVYIPHFLSWTVVVSITALLFAIDTGPLWTFFAGLFGTDANMLADPDWFRPLVLMQMVWKDTGWGTIIFLAALAGVDQEQYEAAIIDGAGRWQRVRHITIPSILPTITVLLILHTGQILNTGFEQIYLMSNSLNRTVADVFDTYVYFAGIEQGAYSYSTAVGLFKAIVGLVLIFGTNWLAKRFNQQGIF
ncbi:MULTISPECIES: ABC transporter permease [Glycomyces]|uniref:Carbohydrate ABC transporter membrane protein 1 (CUT1 family) n=1 Tax=Glycomyces artemisiae TaxID=1076443 RepID=A0A2T0UX34_9ACTN|nr:ABC transporter permease subunit [Glycomyces artemisiae]NUQ88026.1 sugar ABC transporter permease [Glycomyces artemisiae]PRY62408.1 carbohydrate ABC transporter membrane protein 1 (CUT1 family) [Glycomyces artemisiae]